MRTEYILVYIYIYYISISTGFFDLPHTMMESLEREIESLRLSDTEVRTAMKDMYTYIHIHHYMYI